MEYTSTKEYMLDYQIVREYMMRKYSQVSYTISKGNNCIWVSFSPYSSALNMYFILKDNKIIRIDID